MKPTQHIHPGNQKAVLRPPNPNREQAIFPTHPETIFPERKPGQEIDMANPAKPTVPSNPSHSIAPANPGQSPLIRGPLRPTNPTLFFPPSLRNKIPFYQEQKHRMPQQAQGQLNAERLTVTPNNGSQFKPLQDTAKTTPSPTPINQEINRDSNDNPVITLVGKNDKV